MLTSSVPPPPHFMRTEARLLAAALLAWRDATPEEWAAEPDRLRTILRNASRALEAAAGMEARQVTQQEDRWLRDAIKRSGVRICERTGNPCRSGCNSGCVLKQTFPAGVAIPETPKEN